MISASSPLPPLKAPVRRSEKIGNERPHAEIDRGARFHQVHNGQASKGFRKALGQCPGQCSGRRGASLGGDGDVTGQPELGNLNQHLGVVFSKPERRHDRATPKRAERTFQEPPFLAQVQVEKRDDRLDMVNFGDTQRERLRRAGEFSVGYVHVMNIDVLAVLGRDKRLPEHVDVLQRIGQSCGVVQVGQHRRPVFLFPVIENADGLSGSAEIHPFPTDLTIVLRVRRIGDVFPGRDSHQVLYKSAGKTQPAVVTEHATSGQGVVQDFRDRIADSNVLQDVERGVVDSPDIVVAEGLVGPARHARLYGLPFDTGRPQGASRFTPAGTSRPGPALPGCVVTIRHHYILPPAAGNNL